MIFPAVEGALYCAEEHSKQSTLSSGREDTFLHFLKTVFLPLYSLPSQTRIYRHRSPEQLLGLISEWRAALALFFFLRACLVFIQGKQSCGSCISFPLHWGGWGFE